MPAECTFSFFSVCVMDFYWDFFYLVLFLVVFIVIICLVDAVLGVVQIYEHSSTPFGACLH